MEELNIWDVVVDYNKQYVQLYFSYANMKQIKTAINNNRYQKLKILLGKANELTVYCTLCYALHSKYDRLAKKIIKDFYANAENKFDINKNNSEIFKIAIYYDRQSIIKLLIKNKAYISTENDFALIKYCANGNCDMAEMLINKGADIYAKDCIALITAAGNGHIGIIKLLITKGMEKKVIKLDIENYTATNFDLALLNAAKNNNIEIILYLLELGANPSINNSEILINSAANGNVVLVKLFLEKGADPNVFDGIVLKKSVQNGHIAVVKVLSDFQIDGKYVCDLGINDSMALRWAALRGYYDIAKILLESKTIDGLPRCNVNADNNDAYRLASKFGHSDIAKLLEQYGGAIRQSDF